MVRANEKRDEYNIMKIGPRYKICKRLGNGVFEKCQTQKYTLREPQRKTGGRRPRMLSDYGKQLIEKQRVRFTYGITEKQLAKYVREAIATKGTESTEMLFETLESRLDNVVFRIGLAPTRRAARQMVTHGHIKVNGKKVSIPSYITKEKDVISVASRSKDSKLFEGLGDRLAETTRPVWVEVNVKKMEGTLKNTPSRQNTETMLDLGVVLEFYSR